MHSYTAKGGDGYTMFENCKYSITFENAIRMAALMMRFYKPTSLNSIMIGDLDSPILKRHNSSKMDRMSQLIYCTV
jgi:hypothetical protein